MPVTIRELPREGSEKGDAVKAPSTVLLSERVYQLLKQDIITGVLKPGSSLTEASLAKRFGMSRTPIREACARLQSEGLLELIPNKGYFVNSISLATVQELFQVRAILECAAAELACENKDSKLIARLERLSRESYKLGDRESYVKFIDSNFKFHICIAELSGNRCLVKMLSDVLNQLLRLFYLSLDADEYGPIVTREHAKIVQAIKRSDLKMARKLAYEHAMKSKERVLKAILK